MVILFEWHQAAAKKKSSSGFPMAGEETCLGAVASPLAGYLGKVKERAASLEQCPWCASKGSTYALRSYRINLQESVTLCTNPQCLFPLVSRSVEDVLASLEPAAGNKRKKPLSLENEELINGSPKRQRSSELESCRTQSFTGTPVANVQMEFNENDGVSDCPVANITEVAVLENGTDSSACTDSSEDLLITNGNEPSRFHSSGTPGVSLDEGDPIQVKSQPELLNGECRQTSNHFGLSDKGIHAVEVNSLTPQRKEQTEQKPQKMCTTTCLNVASVKSDTEEALVSVPDQLFWWNTDNLCWLDSLLVALVNCQSLRRAKPQDETQHSFVWHLLKAYDDICAAIQVHHQTGTDGVVRVPNHVLQKASEDLHSLRMSVFKTLQKKLHCKLGQRETPVFAMPLLLAMDSRAEPLFQSAFHWEFMCRGCGAAIEDSVVKTLPTFTNILPEWHPLRGVHLAPCNKCCRKNQRRTMMLERVPPIFMLHFVEGLPDNDVRRYAFDFEGKRYTITTVIQYEPQQKHFVTWTCPSDGFWLEYDDLKHPVCKRHQNLPVPAHEMHIIFWEVEQGHEPRVCSPTSTFSNSHPSTNAINPNSSHCQTDKDFAADQLTSCPPDESLVVSDCDADIVSALSVSEDGNDVMDVTIAADTSIGSTTLLDTFEGLSHDDIITLTLVELKPDADMASEDNVKETKDLTDPGEMETLNTKPDGLSSVTGNKMCPSLTADPTPINSSDTESADGLNDPTYVPGAKKRRRRGAARGAGRGGTRGRGRGRGRGKGVGASRRKDNNAASPKADAQISPPVSSEPSEVNSSCPDAAAASPVPAAQRNNLPVESTAQSPSVVSINVPPVFTGNKSPTTPTVSNQNSRWSFMVSKCMSKLGPTPVPDIPATQTLIRHAMPAPTVRFSPNPVKRLQIPMEAVVDPHLGTEQSDGFPQKAATMYVGFMKHPNTRIPLQPSPAVPPALPLSVQSITAHKQNLLTPSKAPKHPDIVSPKEHSTKLPPGLCETDVLRYKLMKKLKSKKKKLAKLNELLCHQGGASLRPDSTILSSPSTVTSSTYDGSTCNDIFSDLLSPATTVSNLSPDSSGYLDVLGKGQDGGSQVNCGGNAVSSVPQIDTCMNGANSGDFMDEFLWEAVDRPTELESEPLSALDLFI